MNLLKVTLNNTWHVKYFTYLLALAYLLTWVLVLGLTVFILPWSWDPLPRSWSWYLPSCSGPSLRGTGGRGRERRDAWRKKCPTERSAHHPLYIPRSNTVLCNYYYSSATNKLDEALSDYTLFGTTIILLFIILPCNHGSTLVLACCEANHWSHGKKVNSTDTNQNLHRS